MTCTSLQSQFAGYRNFERLVFKLLNEEASKCFFVDFFKISFSINFSCSFISQRIAIFLFTNRRELFLEKCGGKSDRIHTQSSLKYPKVRYAFAKILATEAATQRCFQEKMFWKYAANLQENSHAEVWFQ